MIFFFFHKKSQFLPIQPGKLWPVTCHKFTIFFSPFIIYYMNNRGKSCSFFYMVLDFFFLTLDWSVFCILFLNNILKKSSHVCSLFLHRLNICIVLWRETRQTRIELTILLNP